jgi:hypothetical protein
MKRGPGQPRKHASNAAKQAAYRCRKKREKHERLVQRVIIKTPIPDGKSLGEVERELRALPTKVLLEQERALWGTPGAAGKHSRIIAMLKRVVREQKRLELS